MDRHWTILWSASFFLLACFSVAAHKRTSIVLEFCGGKCAFSPFPSLILTHERRVIYLIGDLGKRGRCSCKIQPFLFSGSWPRLRLQTSFSLASSYGLASWDRPCLCREFLTFFNSTAYDQVHKSILWGQKQDVLLGSRCSRLGIL